MAELLAHVVRSELASLGSSLQVPYNRAQGGWPPPDVGVQRRDAVCPCPCLRGLLPIAICCDTCVVLPFTASSYALLAGQ